MIGTWIVHPSLRVRGVVNHIYSDNVNDRGALVQVDFNFVFGRRCEMNLRQSDLLISKDQKSKWGME